MLNRDWWGLSCLWELSKASKPKYSGETDKQQRNTRNFFLCKEKYFSSSNQNSITQFPCLSKYFSNRPKIHLVVIKMSTSPLFDIDSERTWHKRWKPHSLSSLSTPLRSEVFEVTSSNKELVVSKVTCNQKNTYTKILKTLTNNFYPLLRSLSNPLKWHRPTKSSALNE